MSMAKRSGHPADHLCTRSSDLSVACSTERSSHGPAAPYSGGASSLAGGELVAALLVTFLFVVVLVTPFERLILPERDGKELSPSSTSDSLPKRKSGGTARGQYEEK